jgi:hypothetical protein
MTAVLMSVVRLVCPHRVVVDDGRGFVCNACGTRLSDHRVPLGRRALLQRARS